MRSDEQIKQLKVFYHSAKWRKIRQHILNEYPVCYYCQLNPSDSVHHIKPLHTADGWQYRLTAFINDDEPNLVGVCVGCHTVQTRQEQQLVKKLKQDQRYNELNDFD